MGDEYDFDMPVTTLPVDTAAPPLTMYTRWCPATLIYADHSRAVVRLRYAPWRTRAIPETVRTDAG